MIEINLLPEDLKLEIKRSEAPIPAFVFIIPVVLGLVIIAHICLLVLGLGKNVQLLALNNTWKNLEPKRAAVEGFRKDNALMSADTQLVQNLLKKRVNWAHKLNLLSLNLPGGIWFTEVSLQNNEFILKGSVISLQKEEVGTVNGFLDSLKTDSGFMKDFSRLDLGPLKRTAIGGYDLIDFMFSGSVKSEDNAG